MHGDPPLLRVCAQPLGTNFCNASKRSVRKERLNGVNGPHKAAAGGGGQASSLSSSDCAARGGAAAAGGLLRGGAAHVVARVPVLAAACARAGKEGGQREVKRDACPGAEGKQRAGGRPGLAPGRAQHAAARARGSGGSPRRPLRPPPRRAPSQSVPIASSSSTEEAALAMAPAKATRMHLPPANRDTSSLWVGGQQASRGAPQRARNAARRRRHARARAPTHVQRHARAAGGGAHADSVASDAIMNSSAHMVNMPIPGEGGAWGCVVCAVASR